MVHGSVHIKKAPVGDVTVQLVICRYVFNSWSYQFTNLLFSKSLLAGVLIWPLFEIVHGVIFQKSPICTRTFPTAWSRMRVNLSVCSTMKPYLVLGFCMDERGLLCFTPYL